MGIVQHVVDTSKPQVLTEEMIAELIALKDRPIDYSDDPKMTREEYRIGRLLAVEMRKRKMFSLRLHPSTIKWWKEQVGEGYTTIMARLLDEAVEHPEWITETFKQPPVPVSLRGLLR